MSEGIPQSGSNESRGVLDDPVIDRIKRAIIGMELTQEIVRQAISDTQEELSEEIAMETEPEVRRELMRQQNLLVIRGNDIIADLVPSAEMVEE